VTSAVSPPTNSTRRINSHSSNASSKASSRAASVSGAAAEVAAAQATAASSSSAATAAAATTDSAAAANGSVTFDLNDEQWWRDALRQMTLDTTSFTQPPLSLAGGGGAAVLSPSSTAAAASAQLALPFGAPPPSPSSNVLPLFHLTEEAYLSLAPRVLATFPHINLLRFKLVPARLSEERFWRTLFLLAAQFHVAATQQQQQQQPQQQLQQQHQQPHQSQQPLNSSRPASALPKALRNGGISIPPSAASGGPPPSFPPLPMLPNLQPLPPLPLASSASAATIAGAPPAAHSAIASAPAQHQHPPVAAVDTAQLRDLQAALAARDAQIAAQTAQISLLTHKLQGVTSQLHVLQTALSLTFQIADPSSSADVGALSAAAATTAAATGLQPTVPSVPSPTASAPPALVGAPAATAVLPAGPPVDTSRLNTAPVDSAAAAAVTSTPGAVPHSHAHAPTAHHGKAASTLAAHALFECARCHARVSAEAPEATACRTHGKGWTLTKDSQEFFDLPAELRGNLRAEKQKRLKAVLHEMRFIVDEDDKTKAPGTWTCCGKEEYDAPGCNSNSKHTLQPAK
jgi:hypothetical protein